MRSSEVFTKLLALVSTLLSSFAARGDALEHWYWRDALHQPYSLQSLAFGNGKFVAVGLNGAILTWPNGIEWQDKSLGTNISLMGVTYGDKFVAVGDSCILVSTNADNWVWVTNPPAEPLRAVIYGNGLYIAVGGSNSAKVYTSSTGYAWTDVSPLPQPGSELYGIAQGNGMFMAFGKHSVLTSTNGTVWLTPANFDPNTFATVDLIGLAFGSGTFAVITDYTIYSSTNGAAWSKRFDPQWPLERPRLYTICFGDRFIVASVSRTIASPDGLTWSMNIYGSDLVLRSTLWGQGYFVGVGNGQNDFFGSVRISPDGVNWASPKRPDLGLTYGNGEFVAVGYSGIIHRSSDGRVWQKANQNITSTALTDVTFFNGMYVIVGYSGTILHSTNSVDWFPSLTAPGPALVAITHGTERYVAVGENGRVVTSTDGLSWDSQISGVTNRFLLDVAFGNGLFVAVGSGGLIITSPDGVSWTQRRDLAYPNFSETIAFGNGRFVACGRTSSVSTNGIDWVDAPDDGKLHFIQVQDICFANGLFLTTPSSTRPGYFLTSIDGMTWNVVNANVSLLPVTRLAYGGGTFVAVSYGILQSENVSVPTLSLRKLGSGNGYVLTSSGEVGRKYRLQSSSNFNASGWNYLLSFTNDRPVMSFTNNPSDPQQFYRVISP